MPKIDSRYSALQVLGLQPNADEESIKSAYKKLVKMYHPDSQEDGRLHWQYYDIVEAYEYLQMHPVEMSETGGNGVNISHSETSNVAPEIKAARPAKVFGGGNKGPISYGHDRYAQEREFANWSKRQKKEKKERIKQRELELQQKERQKLERDAKAEAAYEEAMRKINIIRTARAIENLMGRAIDEDNK